MLSYDGDPDDLTKSDFNLTMGKTRSEMANEKIEVGPGVGEEIEAVKINKVGQAPDQANQDEA